MYYLASFSNKTIYGVWWTNRSTATVVSAENPNQAKQMAQRKKKEGYGEVKGVKLLNEKDASLAKKGKWVRTRYDSAKSSQKSKFRPWLAKKQTKTISGY